MKDKSKAKTIKINITFNEIYALLCPKCKKKLRDYIKKKAAEAIAEQLITLPGEE